MGFDQSAGEEEGGMTPAGIDWAVAHLRVPYITGSGDVRILGLNDFERGVGRLEGTNKHAVQVAANLMIRRGAFYHRTKIYDNVRAYGSGREPDRSYSCFLDRDDRRKA
jgi:hypothetical protein